VNIQGLALKSAAKKTIKNLIYNVAKMTLFVVLSKLLLNE